MKITGVGTSGASSTRRTDKTRRAGETFSKHLSAISEGADDAEDVQGVDASSGIGGIETLLAVQSVDPDAGGQGRARKRLVQRGDDLLDRLEEVRQGLLLGAVPKERLGELARLVRSKREAGADAQLAAILDEIELRAEVELAKLARRG